MRDELERTVASVRSEEMESNVSRQFWIRVMRLETRKVVSDTSGLSLQQALDLARTHLQTPCQVVEIGAD